MRSESQLSLESGLVVSLRNGSTLSREDSEGRAGGFVVTPMAYQLFMRENRLDEVAQGILAGIDRSSVVEVHWAAGQIQDLIVSAPLPQALYDQIRRAHRGLSNGMAALSLWAPDKEPFDAHAGDQQRPALLAEGAANTLRAVQSCWASWSGWRRLYRREAQGLALMDFNVAVYVRRAAESRLVSVTLDEDEPEVASGSLAAA